MLSEKEAIRISKFFSLVLRPRPEMIGLQPDQNGWVDVEELIQGARIKGLLLDRQTLQHIVDTNNKKRFAFNEDGTKIRASQGHSIAIDTGYPDSVPPAILYHGTAEKITPIILHEGLLKMNRQHVHLSADKETAIQVGQRHGQPRVLEVAARRMYSDGYSFYLSANGVWLTESVPTAYLHVL